MGFGLKTNFFKVQVCHESYVPWILLIWKGGYSTVLGLDILVIHKKTVLLLLIIKRIL
jgi:hypothetical protein